MNAPFVTVLAVLLLVNLAMLLYVRAVRKRLAYYAALCEDESLKTAEEILQKMKTLKQLLRELPAGLHPERAARAVLKQAQELQNLLDRELDGHGK